MRDKFVLAGLGGTSNLSRLRNCEGLAQIPIILPTIRLNSDEV